MASLKVAVTILVMATPEALFAGSVENTVGAATDPVVNVQTESFGNEIPTRLLASAVIVAVYTVPAKRVPEGVKDTVVPVYLTVPATEVALCTKIKVVEEKVNGFIGSLKVAVTTLLMGTSEALLK